MGAQWGFKQETIQVGTVTADSHMPIKLSKVGLLLYFCYMVLIVTVVNINVS